MKDFIVAENEHYMIEMNIYVTFKRKIFLFILIRKN